MPNQTLPSEGSSKQPVAGKFLSYGQLPIMRSQLSARLLQNNPRSVSSDGELTPWWKRGSSYQTVVKAMPLSAPGSLTGGSRPGGSSGYNADSERTSTQSDEMATSSPPVSIDFLARGKKRSSPTSLSSDYGKGKKRKLEEDSYNAAMAKEDILRAGLTIPTLQTSKATRLLRDNAGVSMSRVEHLYSRDADDSPFWSSFPLINFSTDLYNDATALSNIVKTCVSYYPTVSMSPSPTCSEKPLHTDSTTPNARDYESSTSSVTEDMDSSEAEEAETANDPKADVAVVSMGDALSLCQDARIITLSEVPYTIVHVNAAFSRVTGLTSTKVLGRPFGDLIENESMLEILQNATETLKASIVPNTGFKTKTLAKKQECMSCTVIVSPVAGISTKPATHLVMEVRPEAQSSSAAAFFFDSLMSRQQSPPPAAPLQSIG